MDRFGKHRSHDSAMGYDLAPTARSLELPGEAVIRPSPALALDALAADLLAQAITCVRHFGDFHLAIGGDDSIEALYLRLMSDTDLRAIPWKKTHLWMTHERRVEEDDERRLATALREFIIDHSDIPREQAHLIPIQESDAPQQYERALREALGWRERGHDRLDCVILAIEPGGEAGGRALVSENQDEGELLCDWTASNGSPDTLALTRRLVCASRFIAVMGFGEERRGALQAVTKRPEHLSIRPVAGELRWYLDEAIASGA